MNLSRRAFVTAASAFGTVGGQAVFGADEMPIWKAGIMTDTHVQTGRKDASAVRMACDLFARHRVDLVANCGDICETYDPRGYAAIRKVYDEAFAARPPEEIWVYANHEWVRRSKGPHDVVMADVQRHLKAKNGPYAAMTFRGYPIIVVPQMTWDEKKIEAMIGEAEKAHPDARIPVFVFDHEAGWDTNDNTLTWGTYARRTLYSRHPRVILISGHAHSSLRSELNCWLGSYASINAGRLDRWRGDAAGFTLAAKPEYGVLIMEVYRSRVVFRRFDVRDGFEYSPDKPWTVSLPFAPSKDPFAWLRAQDADMVPQFPRNAKLKVAAVGEPCTKVDLRFPVAPGGKDYLYRIDISNDCGELIACREEYGQFYLRETERTPEMALSVPAGYFDSGEKYTLSVTPCDCLRRGGESLSAKFQMRSRAGTRVWESADPMTECRFRSGRVSGGSIPVKDGFYQMKGGFNRLELPPEIWQGGRGARFRLIVDLEMKTSGVWAFVVGDTRTGRPVNSRIYSPRRTSFRQRVVVEFSKPDDGFTGNFTIKEGGRGEVRFLRVRLDRV
jgi:hypothetical protein